VLDERSVLWRHAGDARMLPFLSRAFLLQAAHPTIAAGMADHSGFRTDPFGRFRQSWWLVLRTIYAPDGEQIGAAVRRGHERISGVTAAGRGYHAFEPEAYFWVLATGFDTVVSVLARVGRPLSLSDERRAYAETRELGLRFGLREQDMAPTLEGFRDWYAWVLTERLEDNPTVRDVLATIRRPAPPGGFPRIVWPLPRLAVGRLVWLTTIGTLPPQARDRLHIPWSATEAAQLSGLLGLFRILSLLPASWCRLPPAREGFARPLATHRLEA
jgi:uncharacterized protein (DUF2236 family)